MTDQLQLLQDDIHPRSIAGLRNFFSAYFTVRKELELDQSASAQRSLPEFFLTYVGRKTNEKWVVHLLFQQDTPKKDELEKKLREQSSSFLDTNLITTIFHQSEARETLYQDFKASGVTYYLNPAAIRALSQLRVAQDPYGIYHLTVLWLHVLAFLLFTIASLAEWNWAFVLIASVMIPLSYIVFSALGNLPPVRKLWSIQRRRQFAAIVQDCQVVGRRPLDADLSVEIPRPLLEKLNQLPAERPKPTDVLLNADWRLAEIWDLAHESVEELTKTPESSPEFAFRVEQVDQLLDKALLAFRQTMPQDSAEDPIAELFTQVSRHAALLGIRTTPHPLQTSGSAQKVN